MSKNVNTFISNMGALCEMWLITYKQFVDHGLDHKAALEHTQSVMTSFMQATYGNKGGDQ